MEVYILAAGAGTRLQSSLPKPLTFLISGETLLSRQVRLIEKAFPLAQIHLVIGYKKDLIKKAFPKIPFIENPDYAQENTAGSLRRALRHAKGDILFLNGDVVFHSEVLALLKECNNSTGIVNNAETADEEVKYTLNAQGTIQELSKTIEKGEGEALGMWLIKEDLLNALKEELLQTDPTEYFEKALEGCLSRGHLIYPLTIPKNWAVEVDFPEDLKKANQLVASWE